MESTTRYKTTARTQALMNHLQELAREIDSALIDAASPAARGEWVGLRRRWPTPAEIGSGIVGLSDRDLELVIGKVTRFKAILAGSATQPVVLVKAA